MGVPRRNTQSERQLREAHRQATDRKWRIHSKAYQFIQSYHKRTGRVPQTEALAEWIADMQVNTNPGKLIEGMIDKGWLIPHLKGYKLMTETSPESIIPGLIEAYENRNDSLFNELRELWESHKGAATRKIGRIRDDG